MGQQDKSNERVQGDQPRQNADHDFGPEKPTHIRSNLGQWESEQNYRRRDRGMSTG